ncbi:MAG: VOC family protein [Pseudomonadales bacterium]|jgi:predicted enzyme related to lactoylglutathione lyase
MRFSAVSVRDAAVDAWFDERQGELGEIARHWFESLRSMGDDVRELLHDGCPVATVRDVAFGYVNVFSAHVNVGFFLGASLDDPAGMLEGTGKRMRHVKLKPGKEPDPEALMALIECAYRDAVARLAVEAPPVTYRLRSVRVFSLRWEETVAFYRDVVGFPVAFIGEAFGWAEFDLGSARLGLERCDPDDPEAQSLVGRFLGVSVAVDDIQATYEALTEKGVPFLGPPERQPWGGTLAHFSDPDGNVVTLLGSADG